MKKRLTKIESIEKLNQLFKLVSSEPQTTQEIFILSKNKKIYYTKDTCKSNLTKLHLQNKIKLKSSPHKFNIWWR